MSTHHTSRLAIAAAAIVASLSLPGSGALAAGPAGPASPAALAPAAVQACWDFSTLQQATPYRLGDTFVAPNATIEMKRYILNGNLNANPAGLGWTRPSQIAGGPAPEFRLYLLNAHVEPNTPQNSVTFNFGHQLGLGGGQANLGVNGSVIEITTSLAALNGIVMGDPAIGMAQVSVALDGPVGTSPERGTLTLTALSGQIEQWAVGGVQLYVDNVCMQ